MHFVICRQMDRDGLLNCEDEVQLYCLHKSFVPLIKDSLEEFKVKWNGHPIRTAGFMNPAQLHLVGLHNLLRSAGENGKYYPELDQVLSYIYCSI